MTGQATVRDVLQVEPVPVLREGRNCSMAIRVALIGTGNCGSLALKQLVSDARFDLTGVWVSSDAKVGKDAGELAGLDVTTGIAATNDLDAIIAAKPDCIVYCAMGDTRLPEAMADVRRILAAGINVVGSAPGVLPVPVAGDSRQVHRTHRRCCATKVIRPSSSPGSIPGFATDLLPFALAGTCQSIEQVRTMEIADYATYDGATVMFDVMGFGNADRRLADAVPARRARASPGAPRSASSRRASASRSTRSGTPSNRSPRRRTSTSRPGTSRRARSAALRFQIEGMVKGKPVIVVEHVTRLRADLRPGLGAARAARRLVPRRDHRRAVVRRATSARRAATATTTTRPSSRRPAGS